MKPRVRKIRYQSGANADASIAIVLAKKQTTKQLIKCPIGEWKTK